jgi:hypothetical protein
MIQSIFECEGDSHVQQLGSSQETKSHTYTFSYSCIILYNIRFEVFMTSTCEEVFLGDQPYKNRVNIQHNISETVSVSNIRFDGMSDMAARRIYTCRVCSQLSMWTTKGTVGSRTFNEILLQQRPLGEL